GVGGEGRGGGQQGVGVALVGVGDELRDRDEAVVGTRRRHAPDDHGQRERDQLADRSPTGWLISSHRSPTRSTTWNGPGTSPSGVGRRRCGSDTNASGTSPFHRRSNSGRERKRPSRRRSRYVGGVKSIGSSRVIRRRV